MRTRRPTETPGRASLATAWTVVAMAAVATVAVLLHAGRGRTFFFDEWDWVQHRRSGGLTTLLTAHNHHISAVPVLLFRTLFETVGLAPVWPYRTLTAVGHALCGLLLFPIAARRVGLAGGLVTSLLFLGLGAAWQTTLWGLQVGVVLSLLGGLVAWDALDRGGRVAGPVASAGLLLASASFSFGAIVALGVLVELLMGRRWRQLWVPLLPLALAAAWTLRYGGSDVTAAGLRGALPWAVEAAATAAGGIVGRGLPWGRAALLAIVALVAVGFTRRGWSARAMGLLVVAATFWLVTGAARSASPRPESPDASRYVEIGAPLIMLVLIEAWRGARVPRHAAAGAAVTTALVACLALGFDALRAGGATLQANSDAVRADLAAVEIMRAGVPVELRPSPDAAPQIVAGDYLAAVDDIGESALGAPATDAARALPDASRARSDVLLLRLGVTVTEAADGEVSPPCRAASTAVEAALTPGDEIVVQAGDSEVTVEVRRFGPSFQPPLAPVPAHTIGRVVTVEDGSPQRWQVRLSALSPFTMCTG